MTKTVTVKVLNLDGVPDESGETFERGGIEFNPEVPVTLGFERELAKTIGTAKLFQKEDGLYAEITLSDSKTIAGLTLYPAVGGTLLEREGNTLKRTSVTQIGLCPGKNCDKRIEPLVLPEN